MESETIRNPKVSTLEGSEVFVGTPEVIDINYDLWILRISLRFESTDHPVYVLFDGVRGFRVLDEGDLLEFWSADTRVKGWLWRIENGGWFDLEKLREGFVSGVTGGYKEFLILGVNDCVSVIADDEPRIESPTP